MGCIILMAVRHTDLDEVAKIDPKSLDHQYNREDYQPKRFDQGAALGWNSHPLFKTQDNVILSHFYESNQQALLLVNGDMLIRPDGMSFCHTLPSALEDLLPVINDQLIVRRKTAYTKSEAASRPQLTGESVTLFALDLDSFDRFAKNPHAMEDVAHYCRTKEANMRTFGHGNLGILGTAESGEAFLVLANRWSFQLLKIPGYAITLTDDEQTKLASKFSGNYHDRSDGANLYQQVLMREFMAGFGYEETPLPKKSRKPSAKA